MRLTILFAFLSLLVFCACKKDKLDGDADVLIGRWQWLYSTNYNYCDPEFPFTTVLTPVSESATYEIEFFPKGIVSFRKDNVEIDHYRIVFSKYGGPQCEYLGSVYDYFGINLNNDPNNELDGCVCSDTIMVQRGFPYLDPENGCEDFKNYFVRVE